MHEPHIETDRYMYSNFKVYAKISNSLEWVTMDHYWTI